MVYHERVASVSAASIRMVYHERVAKLRVEWTRTLTIQTISEINVRIKILPAQLPYLYQNLSQKATELYLLGLSYIEIGKILGIDPKTVKKAVSQNNHKKRK